MTQNEIEFVRATDADKAYLLQLRKLTMTAHLEASGLMLSDAEHLFRLEDNYAHAHIIFHRHSTTQNRQLIGGIQFKEDTQFIKLFQLQIHPDYQSNGLGTTILRHLIKESEQRQLSIKLSVLKTNKAQHLYMRLGFQLIKQDQHELYMQYHPRTL